MPTLKLGNTTAMTESGGVLTYLNVPAGHIIKTYHKAFKARQAFTNTGPSLDSNYITVGTGASGADGDPLQITTDTPASSSSKYLITCTLHQSRSQDGMLGFRLMYNNAGTHTAITLGNVSGSSQSRVTFGRGHPSTLGNSGNYGLAQTGIMYLWEPASAAAQTIFVKGCNYNTTANHINVDDIDTNSSHTVRAISTLTVQEVAG